MNILFSLSHIGYTVSPQADAGWMGEAGPGPFPNGSRLGWTENDFTDRDTAFLVWSCLHLTRMCKDAGLPFASRPRPVTQRPFFV